MRWLGAWVLAFLLLGTVADAKPVHVKSYTRKDGTVVREHTRGAPKSHAPTSPTTTPDSSNEPEAKPTTTDDGEPASAVGLTADAEAPAASPIPAAPVVAKQASATPPGAGHNTREGFFLGAAFGVGTLVSPDLEGRGFDRSNGLKGAVGDFRIGVGVNERVLLLAQLDVLVGIRQKCCNSELFVAHWMGAAQFFLTDAPSAPFARASLGVAHATHQQPSGISQTVGPCGGLSAGYEYRPPGWPSLSWQVEVGGTVEATKDYFGATPFGRVGLVWYW